MGDKSASQQNAPNASIAADIFFSNCHKPLCGSEDETLLFHYALGITGGFSEFRLLERTDNVATTDLHDLASGKNGFRTAFFEDVLELPEIAPGEQVFVRYVMTAKGSAGDFEEGFSARIGDPFDLTGGGFLRLEDATGPGPGPGPGVPEPQSLILLVMGLAGWTARVRKRRNRNQPRPPSLERADN
jgi:hypothetical protein